MRLSTLLLASLTGLATANFDLYLGHQVFGVFAYGPYLSQDDVSGRTIGVRCAGSGCYGGAATNINVLEMHFSNNPLYHWTIYKDRGHPYKIYGLDGRTYGEYILFPGVNFHHLRFAETRSGVRKFRCLTQFTAAQIRAGR
ncbi:uncharacterized protein PODANS_2_7998 [Podospora anserina S mat+]|uniref:Podospora anserina S mat+ genomic DNA chromosome 2, supercontig 2 n=1 Tax=Podospora anserina (strain S / ATCC MYA-4624 / DSM 980 / FGSC 10383) TaxID=515849 RepID=B2B6J7_PODAN|nr:uncharacterized protein PODANS_2_7998 [Podospora anserina S mat+]CAP73423.1 unnamed protein product [Podospora anserina S mat+]CDP25825.1 Putative protein of unknown function [Podospora anserina S mat+]